MHRCWAQQRVNINANASYVDYTCSMLSTSISLDSCLTCFRFRCSFGAPSHIGVTQTSLSRTLTMHRAEGAPGEHLSRKHDKQLSREMLVNNAQILLMESDTKRILLSKARCSTDKNLVMEETSSYTAPCFCCHKWFKTIVQVATTMKFLIAQYNSSCN